MYSDGTDRIGYRLRAVSWYEDIELDPYLWRTSRGRRRIYAANGESTEGKATKYNEIT